MDRRNFTRALAMTPLALKLGHPAWSEGIAPQASATVTVDVTREVGRVDPKIYGHFIEHVERVVYGGIYDQVSPKSDSSGIRQDVIAAIREMGGAHVLRWPGGNFASYYDWRDGIGPRQKRPTRFDVVWKNRESNAFGTDEYLQVCRELACEPFITANLGDGTLREACEWVQYTRQENRKPPVAIWGLGNEHYGAWQVGHYTAQEYGRKAQQFGQFMRAVSPDLKFLAVGNPDPQWNEGLLKEYGDGIDWLTLHLYSHRYFLDGVDDFDSSVAAPVFFEKVMKNMIAQLEVAEPLLKRDKPIEICLEEWNGRHYKKGVGPGAVSELLRESPRDIVDALFVAGVFNLCQRLSSRVTMTNYVFILNAHGPLFVYPNAILKTVLFDVFRQYSVLSQPVSVATDVRCEMFSTDVQQAGPAVPVTAGRIDASATRSVDSRKITLALVNRYKTQSCRVTLDFKKSHLQSKARWHVLHSNDLFAVNTLTDPDRVRTTITDWSITDGTIELPPASVNHLELFVQ